MSWWSKFRGEDTSHRVLYVIIALTVVVFAAFFLIGYDHPFAEDPDFIEPRLTSVLLVFMILIVLLAVGVTVWAIVSAMRKRGKADKTVNRLPVALISTSVVVGTMAVMIVAFLVGSNSAVNVNGKAYDNPTWLRVADMFVISALVLMVLATAAVAIATIRSHFKRK